MRVYVTNDNSNVYQDKFMSIACGDSGYIRPTLILLGTRLGIDNVTPVYWDALTAVLQYPQSMGIAGYVIMTTSELPGIGELIGAFFQIEGAHQRRITLLAFKDHIFSTLILITLDLPCHTAQPTSLTSKKNVILTILAGCGGYISKIWIQACCLAF